MIQEYFFRRREKNSEGIRLGIVDAIFFCLMALGFPLTLWGLMLDMTKSKLNWSAGKSSCSKWSKLSADRGWDKPVFFFFYKSSVRFISDARNLFPFLAIYFSMKNQFLFTVEELFFYIYFRKISKIAIILNPI